jgi:hypothetical protein
MSGMNAKRDGNFVPTLLGTSYVDGVSTVPIYADPTTHRLFVESSGISSSFNTDVFTSTNGQTVFTASQNVAYTIYLSINGSIQTPNVDYTVAGGVATLTNGIPSGNIVVWVYATS